MTSGWRVNKTINQKGGVDQSIKKKKGLYKTVVCYSVMITIGSLVHLLLLTPHDSSLPICFQDSSHCLFVLILTGFDGFHQHTRLQFNKWRHVTQQNTVLALKRKKKNHLHFAWQIERHGQSLQLLVREGIDWDVLHFSFSQRNVRSQNKTKKKQQKNHGKRVSCLSVRTEVEEQMILTSGGLTCVPSCRPFSQWPPTV